MTINILFFISLFLLKTDVINCTHQARQISTSKAKARLFAQCMQRRSNNHTLRLPKDLVPEVINYMDSDARIWFEAFQDPLERMREFNASTWDQLYQQCDGSNHKIAQRMNTYQTIQFDPSFDKIISICTRHAPDDNINTHRKLWTQIKSLNISHLKKLRSLESLDLSWSLDGGKVPDFNGWTDKLIIIDLGSNNLRGPVTFTGFPPNLYSISLQSCKLSGSLVITQGFPYSMQYIDIRNNPDLVWNPPKNAVSSREEFREKPFGNDTMRIHLHHFY